MQSVNARISCYIITLVTELRDFFHYILDRQYRASDRDESSFSLARTRINCTRRQQKVTLRSRRECISHLALGKQHKEGSQDKSAKRPPRASVNTEVPLNWKILCEALQAKFGCGDSKLKNVDVSPCSPATSAF